MNTTPERVPLPGQGELQLWMRSNAPFKEFGVPAPEYLGGYAGDNREESTDSKATARVVYILAFDYMKMAILGSSAFCHKSHGHGLFPGALAYTAVRAGITHQGVVEGRAIATTRTMSTYLGRPGTGFAISVQLAAGNPLVGLAADIDIQLNLRVMKEWNNALKMSGNIMGDGFPNCEIFVRDAADDTFLIHGYRTPGGPLGPYWYLSGQNFRLMGGFGKRLTMSPIGLIDS